MLSPIRSALSKIGSLFFQRRLERDSNEELRAHLDMLTDRYIGQGMAPEAARYAARRQFGGVTQLNEDLRTSRGIPQLQIVLQDVRYALRQLRKAPAFTTAAVITLALGIGANTAVFAVINAVLLQPLPYAEPDRLVSLQSLDRRGKPPFPTSLSYPTFFDFREQNRVFDHLVSFRDSQFSITGESSAIHVTGEIVSWDLFTMLGVNPELGRGFLAEEERPGIHVVVFSHELWRRQFAGDRNILGRQVAMGGKPYTVVGIAPPGFRFPPHMPTVELWTTLSEDAGVSEFTSLSNQRGARVLDAIGRLKPGVTTERARAQMDKIAASLAKAYPDDFKNMPATYIQPLMDRLTGEARGPMMILLGAVGLVLLIACANIANLLLARSIEREREFAVRAAMGASRGTVIRQLLTESLLLATLGCLAGVLFAVACLRYLMPLAGDSIPRITGAALDPRVLGFSIVLAVVTSVLFSLAPAIQIARTDLVTSLKQGTRGIASGHERLRRILVVGQIALGLVLLSSATVLIVSFMYLERRDPGMRPDHVLTFNFSLPDQYNTAKQIDFSDRLLSRLRSMPGVQSVATGFPLPFTGDQMSVSFDIKERPAAPPDRPHADIAIVSPGYFSTMGITLLKGRDFVERDTPKTAQVVIVNQAFADQFFPGEEIIGKTIESGATNGTGKSVVQQVVGLVVNAKQSALRDKPEPIYYFPYKQLSWGIGNVVLRTTVPPLSLEPAIRSTIAALEKQAPVFDVAQMDTIVWTSIARPRFQMLLFGTFAGIALLLTVVGLYGVLAYSVMKRTREIGVRIALGATRRAVLGMVLREAVLLVSTGVVIGLAGAIGSGQLLQKMAFGVTPGNPLLLIIACCTLTVTSLIAAYLPAMRAASVDPLHALRLE